MSIRHGLLDCLGHSFHEYEVAGADTYRAEVAVGSRRVPVLFQCTADEVVILDAAGRRLAGIPRPDLVPETFRWTVREAARSLGGEAAARAGRDAPPAAAPAAGWMASPEEPRDLLSWMDAGDPTSGRASEATRSQPATAAADAEAEDDPEILDACARWVLDRDPAAFETAIETAAGPLFVTGVPTEEDVRWPRPALSALHDGVLLSRPPVEVHGRRYRPALQRILWKQIAARLLSRHAVSEVALALRIEAAGLAIKGDQRVRNREVRSALAAYRAALALAPDDPGLMAAVGRILVMDEGSAEDLDLGRALLDQAVELRPCSVAALRARAHARARALDPAGARTDLERALRLRPRDETLLSEAASQALAAADPVAARRHFLALAAVSARAAAPMLALLGEGPTGDPRWVFWEEAALERGDLSEEDEHRARERVAIARAFDDFLAGADRLPDAARSPLLTTLASAGSPSFIGDLIRRAAAGSEGPSNDLVGACVAHRSAGVRGLARALDFAGARPDEAAAAARAAVSLDWPELGPAVARALDHLLRRPTPSDGAVIDTAAAAGAIGSPDAIVPLLQAVERGVAGAAIAAARIVQRAGRETEGCFLACLDHAPAAVRRALEEAAVAAGVEVGMALAAA